MADVARHFGVPTPLVRYLLECSPFPRPARQTRFGPQTQLHYARSQLTQSEFARLYQQQRLTIKDIAARLDIRHEVIAQLAREYGIEVRL